MSTTALLHGLRVAQHLAYDAALHGFTLSTVTTSPSGDVLVHLAKTDIGLASASGLVDALGLDVAEFADYPDHTTPFRTTVVIYRGTKVTLYGSIPADSEDPRPEPPTYTGTDVTGWDPEDVADMRALDDETEDAYRDSLAKWLARHPEAAVSA